MRVTPSSVAFWTMKSMRSPRAMPCSSVICIGDSRSTATCARTCAATLLPADSLSAAENSPPVPLNKREWRAWRKPQNARQVFARLRGQDDLRTFGECSGHIDSRQAHASSMPSVAMRASSSISAGAMT